MSLNGSATLKAKKIKLLRLEQNLPVYDAGIGENPFPINNDLIDIVKENVKNYKYGNNIGNIKLKKYLNRENIIIGNGMKPLINVLNIAFSKCYEDYCILLITPCWLSYIDQAKIFNLNYQTIKMCNETFKVCPQKLELKIKDIKSKNSNTKIMLIFNNPCNPTGQVYNESEILKISKIIKKHDCILFSDEIYKDIILDNKKYIDIRNYIDNRCITGFSLSKSLGCGGWRYGWLSFPDELKDFFNITKNLGSTMYSCPTVIFNDCIIELLNKNKKYIQDELLILNKIRDECLDLFSKTKIITKKPEGGWYFWLDFSNYKNNFEKIGIKDSIKLAEYLINEIGLITVCGNVFGVDELCVRYSFVDINFENEKWNINNMKNGLNKLINLLEKLI